MFSQLCTKRTFELPLLPRATFSVRSQVSSNANAIEPLTPTASAVTNHPTVLPASSFAMPVPDEADPIRHPQIMSPWPLIRVIQKNDMNAIVATKPLLKGEKIALFYGEVQTTPTMYTLQIDEDVHVACSSGPAYTNHSCSPVAYFAMDHIVPSSPFPILTALKDIAEGEEITFHYCHTEWKMAVPFFCMCNTDKCMGKIEGFSCLDIEAKRECAPYLAPCLARKWREMEAQATGSS